MICGLPTSLHTHGRQYVKPRAANTCGYHSWLSCKHVATLLLPCRAAPAWMPSALRLLAAALQQLSAGDLNNIDALLGCPLAMPDARMFTDGRCAAAVAPPLPSLPLLVQHAGLLHQLQHILSTTASHVGCYHCALPVQECQNQGTSWQAS